MLKQNSEKFEFESFLLGLLRTVLQTLFSKDAFVSHLVRRMVLNQEVVGSTPKSSDFFLIVVHLFLIKSIM